MLAAATTTAMPFAYFLVSTGPKCSLPAARTRNTLYASEYNVQYCVLVTRALSIKTLKKALVKIFNCEQIFTHFF